MYAESDFEFPRAAVTTPEALQADLCPGAYAALLMTDRSSQAVLEPLAAALGPRLLLPEVWQAVFPQCGVLISSALSGGTFVQRLQEAPEGRSWLLLEPMAMEFSLPCPSGMGAPVSVPETDHAFCSPALCCQYTHFLRDQQGFICLWDTEETLRTKLELAKSHGFCGFAAAEDTKTPTV